MSGKIFINYRRGDDPGFTGRLYDQLENAFDRDNLFMDVDHIAAGADFVRELEVQVAQCDVLLAVIGTRWLDARDSSGSRRIDNPDDFVRIEIESALNLRKLVVPVLVNDAAMPRPEDLPDALKPLARRNAVRLTHERFKPDCQGLIKAVKQGIDAAKPASKSRFTAFKFRQINPSDSPKQARLHEEITATKLPKPDFKSLRKYDFSRVNYRMVLLWAMIGLISGLVISPEMRLFGNDVKLFWSIIFPFQSKNFENLASLGSSLAFSIVVFCSIYGNYRWHRIILSWFLVIYAWCIGVNIYLYMDNYSKWLQYFVCGFVGAFLTWFAVAVSVSRARSYLSGVTMAVVGAVVNMYGALWQEPPKTDLFMIWQASLFAALAFTLQLAPANKQMLMPPKIERAKQAAIVISAILVAMALSYAGNALFKKPTVKTAASTFSARFVDNT